jgi:hypothetical protein
MAQRLWFAPGLFAIVCVHQYPGRSQVDDYLASPEALVIGSGGLGASYEAWFYQRHAVLHG